MRLAKTICRVKKPIYSGYISPMIRGLDANVKLRYFFLLSPDELNNNHATGENQEMSLNLGKACSS